MATVAHRSKVDYQQRNKPEMESKVFWFKWWWSLQFKIHIHSTNRTSNMLQHKTEHTFYFYFFYFIFRGKTGCHYFITIKQSYAFQNQLPINSSTCLKWRCVHGIRFRFLDERNRYEKVHRKNTTVKCSNFGLKFEWEIQSYAYIRVQCKQAIKWLGPVWCLCLCLINQKIDEEIFKSKIKPNNAMHPKSILLSFQAHSTLFLIRNNISYSKAFNLCIRWFHCYMLCYT